MTTTPCPDLTHPGPSRPPAARHRRAGSLHRLAIGGLLLLCTAVRAAPVPPGSADQSMDIDGTPITVYTFRPAGCEPAAWLMVFHGVERNADAYRDYARPLAERLCAVVVAPRFDARRFPTALYQHGGLGLGDPQRWTGSWVERILAALRRSEGADWPYAVIGHSAGGQFLSRYAVSTPSQAAVIVLANPGSHVVPDLQRPLPDGLGGLSDPEAAAQRWLARPVVFLLGTADVRRGRHLPDVDPDLGVNRLERGRHVFEAGRSLAQERGWPFRWRLIEVPSVGHDGRSMLGSAQALEALLPLRQR